MKEYDIPFNYDYDDLFSISKNALQGTPGIYTHNSVRKKDKWDVAPQPNLIKMLKTLAIKETKKKLKQAEIEEVGFVQATKALP